MGEGGQHGGLKRGCHSQLSKLPHSFTFPTAYKEKLALESLCGCVVCFGTDPTDLSGKQSTEGDVNAENISHWRHENSVSRHECVINEQKKSLCVVVSVCACVSQLGG